MVSREFEYWRSARKFRFPVSELCLQYLALEIRALPNGIVGILDWQLRKRCRLPAQKGVVENRQFVKEDDYGPAICSDVVPDQKEDVLAWTQTQQRSAYHQITRQIEGTSSFVFQYLLRLCLAFGSRQATQVDYNHCCGSIFSNHLQRPSIYGVESSTQHLMATHDSVKGLLQSLRIKHPGKAKRSGGIIEGAVWS